MENQNSKLKNSKLKNLNSTDLHKSHLEYREAATHAAETERLARQTADFPLFRSCVELWMMASVYAPNEVELAWCNGRSQTCTNPRALTICK